MRTRPIASCSSSVSSAEQVSSAVFTLDSRPVPGADKFLCFAGTLPLTPMGTDDNWAGWNRGEPPPPVPDFLPASDATRGGTRASAGIIRALQNTLQFLQSSSTDPGGFVPPTSYQSEEPELVSAMVALLRELEALKSRDASSATVLRMAKENLDQRKEQIADLQAELQARGQAVSAVSQGLQDQDRKMQESEQRERDANSKIKKLQEKIQDQQKVVKDLERLAAAAEEELRKAEERN